MYSSWNNYRDYLVKKYGGPFYRVGVDGGFNCPNRRSDHSGGCAFCDGTGSVAVYQRRSESSFTRSSSYEADVAETINVRYASIEAQILKGLEFIKRRYKAEKAALYFQSWTNTYDTIENLRKVYDKGLSYFPFSELIVSTRPDCMGEDVCELLSSYITPEREVWVELGLQSANDLTLERINRGHTASCYMEAAVRAHQYGLKVSTHIILGLPGEGREDYLKTVRCVNESGAEAVKIHNLHVAGGTRIADDFLAGEVVSSSTMRHIGNCVLALRHLRDDIIIERLVCDTPMHRLLEPRHFMDKSLFLRTLDEYMKEREMRQGDLYSLDKSPELIV